MCQGQSCNHESGPTAFDTYCESVAQGLADAVGCPHLKQIARRRVETELDACLVEAQAAFEDIVRTQAFAINMLQGALMMRAGDEPGGCSETTVHELMVTTFCDAVATVASHIASPQAA